MSFARKRSIAHYLFIIPALILFTIFFFIPIFQAITESFFEWDGVSPNKIFIGLDNYKFLFGQEVFRGSIINNIILMLFSVFIQIPIALGIALLINRGIKGYRFFRTVYFLPSIISTVVIGMMWGFMFNPYFGLINQVLEVAGLDFLVLDWLGDKKVALFSLLLVNTWQWIGYMMIIMLSGLANVPIELLEAAEIDGVNALQKLRYIILPMMWGILEVCILLAITGSMKAFDLVYILTGGGPGNATEMMSTYMWKISFIAGRFGPGKAAAVIILVFSITVNFIFQLVSIKRKKALT